MSNKELTVCIPADLFDEIEQYLERQVQDGEAARLLHLLEDLEIERQVRENFPNTDFP